VDESATWPAEALAALRALEQRPAGAAGHFHRRQSPRVRYRACGSLRLFADADGAPRRLGYTRDVGARGLGFVTGERLTTGYGGSLSLRLPDGRTRAFGCTVLRCAPLPCGWYEGAVYFNREQWEFRPEFATPAPAPPRAPGAAARVLVAEDSQHTSAALCASLRHRGYAVEAVADGVEAWRRVREQPPDVLLLDLGMPGMDGLCLLDAMRREPSTRDVPAVVFSAAHAGGKRERVRELGGREFLVKADASLDQVLAAVARHAGPGAAAGGRTAGGWIVPACPARRPARSGSATPHPRA
jgi:CheY-like chemotaxis protein